MEPLSTTVCILYGQLGNLTKNSAFTRMEVADSEGL